MLHTALPHRIVAAYRRVPSRSRSFPSIGSRVSLLITSFLYVLQCFNVRPWTATSEEAIGRTEEISKDDEVVQIKSVPFKSSCLNTITLSGVVVDEPRISQPKDDLTVADVNIAVPKSSRNFNDPSYEHFPLSFFNFSAKQAEKYVKKGSVIVAQGRLRIFRNGTSIAVDEFALLEEGSWPYGDAAAAYSAYNRQSNREPIGRPIFNLYLKQSAERVHGDHDNGMSIDDIGKQRNIKKTTVLSYLAESAYHGKKMDFEWLARQCLLGPRNSQYMEIDDVAMAIEMTAKKHQLTNLGEVPMLEVRDLMKQVKDGVPFKNSVSVRSFEGEAIVL